MHIRLRLVQASSPWGITSSHHKPSVLDCNGQVIAHVDCISNSKATFAENGLTHGQVVRLCRANELVTAMTVLRLLGQEARLVIVGGFGHCTGSFRLAVVSSRP
jgi:hypothetical protein